LPVVEAAHPDRLVGMFRREDVVAAYHSALSATARSHAVPDRVSARTSAGADFFEWTIAPGSVADGRSVSEVPWPEGCLLVSIHRGSAQLVPTGATVLRPGDAITVLGGGEARERLVERLAVPGESETP
jgi:Trk K+ transport system NAD-binding subunit